jgi:hypothetical protein
MIGGRIPPTIGSGAPGFGGAATLRPPPPCSSCAATRVVVRANDAAIAIAIARLIVARFMGELLHLVDAPASAVA